MVKLNLSVAFPYRPEKSHSIALSSSFMNILPFFKSQWKKPEECKYSTANSVSFIHTFNLISPFGSLLNWSLWTVLSSTFGTMGIRYNLTLSLSIINISKIGRIFVCLNYGHIWSSIMEIFFFSTILMATTSSWGHRATITGANPSSPSGFIYLFILYWKMNNCIFNIFRRYFVKKRIKKYF